MSALCALRMPPRAARAATAAAARLSSCPPPRSALASHCQLLQLNMMHILGRMRDLEALARIEAAAAVQ